MLRFEDLRVRDNQDLDRDFFNRRYRLIAESLAELNTQLAQIGTATDNLVTLGLTRVNEVLGPALATASAALCGDFSRWHGQPERLGGVSGGCLCARKRWARR